MQDAHNNAKWDPELGRSEIRITMGNMLPRCVLRRRVVGPVSANRPELRSIPWTVDTLDDAIAAADRYPYQRSVAQICRMHDARIPPPWRRRAGGVRSNVCLGRRFLCSSSQPNHGLTSALPPERTIAIPDSTGIVPTERNRT
jgi:hypothetical protein